MGKRYLQCIPHYHLNVRKAAGKLRGQIWINLHRKNMAGSRGQRFGEIPRPRSNLQHIVLPSQICIVRNARYGSAIHEKMLPLLHLERGIVVKTRYLILSSISSSSTRL